MFAKLPKINWFTDKIIGIISVKAPLAPAPDRDTSNCFRFPSSRDPHHVGRCHFFLKMCLDRKYIIYCESWLENTQEREKLVIGISLENFGSAATKNGPWPLAPDYALCVLAPAVHYTEVFQVILNLNAPAVSRRSNWSATSSLVYNKSWKRNIIAWSKIMHCVELLTPVGNRKNGVFIVRIIDKRYFLLVTLLHHLIIFLPTL